MSAVAAPNRAPYGREAKYSPARAGSRPITTYYDQPQLKQSHYGVRVALYIFIAGLSGGAQLIAMAADLAGSESRQGVVRRGRQIALLGVVLGPPLLIWDLHTPRRFYNMLRIFRRTSPMSIGTYILSGFSVFSLLTAVADLLGWRKAARVMQIPAALGGAGMTTYTAALLAATSTPFWAAAPRALAVEFAASSLASAAAALRLAAHIEGDETAAPALERLAMTATASELVAAWAAERRHRELGVGGTTRPTRAWGAVHQFGAIGLGVAAPLAAYAGKLVGGRARPRLILAASLAVLAGSFALRLSTLGAGNASAEDPRRSLRFARREMVQ